jgi:hypothetical protein
LYGDVWWIFKNPAVTPKFNVSLSKTAFSGTKRRFAVLKIVWQIV